MIKRERYLKALDIVEEYHKQIKIQSTQEKESRKTLTELWVLEQRDKISTRLKNCLLGISYYNRGSISPPIKYIEDISQHDFLRLRNAGIMTWVEFKKLKGIY